MDVTFVYENGAFGGQKAELVFPGHYEEAVENTPARILYTQHHGSGNNYRQCFLAKELDYEKYDELFSMAVVMEKLPVLIDLCFGSFCFPSGFRQGEKQLIRIYQVSFGRNRSISDQE